MIPIFKYGTEQAKQKIEAIASRSQTEYKEIMQAVNEIIEDVKINGDSAVFKYTKKFDKVVLNECTIKVSEEEIKQAYSNVDSSLIEVIRRSASRIRAFHEKQKQNSWFDTHSNEGELLGQLVQPVKSAGVYVPGGKAAYPSSVLMNVIPAQVAGVSKIVMVTPPSPSFETIVAAKESGVNEIYKVGGVQAVAALAFGTKSIQKVDKIVGPGNIYVALAKRAVCGYVGIDSVAGPSEILVVADETANAQFVAADMLSQAEHDELASSILLTTSIKLAENVQKQLEIQTNKLERKDIILKSLNSFGLIIVGENYNELFEMCNKIAPEHLEICTKEPFSLLSKVKNAGAIFLGNYTPEPLGDYMAGPNHVLPTGTTSRFFSPLSVDDFIKKSSVLHFTKEAMQKLANDVVAFANAEGLTAHANSIKVRMGELE